MNGSYTVRVIASTTNKDGTTIYNYNLNWDLIVLNLNIPALTTVLTPHTDNKTALTPE